MSVRREREGSSKRHVKLPLFVGVTSALGRTVRAGPTGPPPLRGAAPSSPGAGFCPWADDRLVDPDVESTFASYAPATTTMGLTREVQILLESLFE